MRPKVPSEKVRVGGRTEEKGMLKVKGPKETGKELEGENVFS